MTSIAVSRFPVLPGDPSLARSPYLNSVQLEAGGEGEQRNVARLLDRQAQAALVAGADTRQTARNDLAPLSYKTLQQANVAVGDRIDLLRAELADLLAAEELAAARTAARATGRTRRTRAARTSVRTRSWSVLLGG